MHRRDFINKNTLALGALSLVSAKSVALDFFLKEELVSKRPPLEKRTFTSKAVEAQLSEVKAAIKDKELAWLFENCYPNTLDTTVDYEPINGKPDTFIITGDIDAMWLRDSTAQVWPYIPLIAKDDELKNLVKGLVSRQAKCVLKDPYANAFYKDLNKESEWKNDKPSPQPGVHERKWEIDSLCYFISLSNRYYELTGDASVFDNEWNEAAHTVVKTFRTEQRRDGTTPYYFIRKTFNPIDAPVNDGKGNPVEFNGMICSMFRPSDDATTYPYLIPSNIFAVLSLRQLSVIYNTVLKDEAFAKECEAFAEEVDAAIKKNAVLNHPTLGELYAYEADGFGKQLLMDDANVPSLISLTYLGAHQPDDAIYKNTRAFVLSNENPYYFKGKAAEGQGSPHTGNNQIWPMGIILRALTSTDTNEIKQCLKMLKHTHAGTGFMHESFDKDNPQRFSRKWFAWANTLFGELMVKIYSEHRELLEQEYE